MNFATTSTQTDRPWKLRGHPRQVAVLAGAAFLGGAMMAAAVDLFSSSGWDSPTLQAWTLVPQIVAAAGLLILGRLAKSRAFYILGVLIALIVVEEAFHVLNPVEDALDSSARWVGDLIGISVRGTRLVLVYGLVAVVGAGMLIYAHRSGSEDERPVVWIVSLLLVVGGFFGGPISTIASKGFRPRWIFVEELGESLVFALVAGYVLGLVIRFRRSV